MPKPANIEPHLKTLHAAYEARTGYDVRWNLARQRQWYDWCEWSDWTWTEADLARVIGYLRARIAAGERNVGALRFTNLIGQPDRFEEDLALAHEAAKGARTAAHRTAPTPQAQPARGLASDGNPLDTGAEAAARFAQLRRECQS